MAGYKILFPLLALLLALSSAVQAEQYRQFGEYRIHYSAFKSDMIEPSVARAHDLTRSRYQAVINITVQRENGEGGFTPVPARVEGSARDIYSKVQTLKFQEVNEGQAIYYLAELPIVDEQTLTLDIRVLPEGKSVAHSFSFERQFFVD